jgi:molecular chaperone GrpE
MSENRNRNEDVVNESNREEQENGQAEAGNGAGSAVSVEDRVAALTAERDEMKDRMLRIAAEFENWKKRARKEQEDSEAKVRESVLRDMLDVIDNLERALGASGKGQPGVGDKKKAGPTVAAPAADPAAVLKGVELVLRLLQSKLERYGVKALETEGQPFDPRLHEAISRLETAAVPPGHVAAEMQRGYRIGERLLRPAMVSVAAAPASAGPPPDSAGDDGA